MRGGSRQVTSSNPQTLSHPLNPRSPPVPPRFPRYMGEESPSGWTKQQISTLALEEAGRLCRKRLGLTHGAGAHAERLIRSKHKSCTKLKANSVHLH